MNGHVGLKQTCNIYQTYILFLSYGATLSLSLSLLWVGGRLRRERMSMMGDNIEPNLLRSCA